MLRKVILLLTIVSVSNSLWEKIFPFEIDIAIGILFLLSFFLNLSLKRMQWKKCLLDKSALILLSAMFLTLTVMSFRGSDYIKDTLNQFVRLTMIMGLSILIVQILNNIQEVAQTLKVFIITTAIVAFSALFSFWSGISSIQVGGVEIELFKPWGGVGARLGGFYEQPNTFATVLVLSIPLGFSFAIISSKFIIRFFWLIIVMICSASLLMSQSRSGIFGCILGIIIMNFMLLRMKRFSRYISMTLLAIIGAIGILVYAGVMDAVFQRLSWEYFMTQQMTGSEPSRLEMWYEGLKLAASNPFGYGAEAKYRIGSSLGVGEKSAHNIFISSLTGMGILGLAGIILLCIIPLINLWKIFHKVNFNSARILSLGLISGLVGFWIHNLVHSVVHWLAVWIYFACVASLLKNYPSFFDKGV